MEQEGFIDASNIQLVDAKGKASRVRIETQEGRRVRVFTTTGERVPEPAAS